MSEFSRDFGPIGNDWLSAQIVTVSRGVVESAFLRRHDLTSLDVWVVTDGRIDPLRLSLDDVVTWRPLGPVPVVASKPRRPPALRVVT